MKVVEKKIKDLVFAEYNPRKLSKEQNQQLKSSMLRFGCVDPVIINTHPDRKNVIVGGHQRCKVWQELGNKTIPCVEVNLTPEKEKELNIRLNKNTGDWDKELLKEFFNPEELVEWGFLLNELDVTPVNIDIAQIGAAINSEVEGNIKFSLELDEESNYVVLKFDRDIDFLQIQTILGLESVHSRDCKGNASKKGVGRVVDGVKAIELIQKAGVL